MSGWWDVAMAFDHSRCVDEIPLDLQTLLAPQQFLFGHDPNRTDLHAALARLQRRLGGVALTVESDLTRSASPKPRTHHYMVSCWVVYVHLSSAARIIYDLQLYVRSCSSTPKRKCQAWSMRTRLLSTPPYMRLPSGAPILKKHASSLSASRHLSVQRGHPIPLLRTEARAGGICAVRAERNAAQKGMPLSS
ncbi:hypothetical protein DENSPDRAFT_697723 [Dentipellis sp. KUC8613]|nr:hypothetical protein DENSPDRAFT_697723 [Dentipellis sp. KUC8613]